MTKLVRVAAILAALILAFALSSCGGDDNGGGTATEATSAETGAAGDEGEAAEAPEEGGAEVPADQADTTVKATLGEYYIKLDTKSVDAGNIKFEATDEGNLEHEFVVIKTDTAPGDLPLSGGDVDEEAAGEVPGEIPSIEPGETKEVTLKLDPGKYVLICNLPGHYAKGQYIGFTVR